MTQPIAIAVLRGLVDAGGERPMTLTVNSAEEILAYIDALEARTRELEEKLIVHFGEVPE